MQPIFLVFGFLGGVIFTLFVALIAFYFGQISGVQKAQAAATTIASSFTPTATPTSSATATATLSPTGIPTDTPVPTETPIATATPIQTPTPTAAPATATRAPAASPNAPGNLQESFQFQVGPLQTYRESLDLNRGDVIDGSFIVKQNDITFRVVNLERHAVVLSRSHISGSYTFHWAATSAGHFALEFDNSYSIWTGKDISLSYVIYRNHGGSRPN